MAAQILGLDERLRTVITRLQDAQAGRNAKSKEIGAAKARGEDAEPILKAVAALKDEIQSGEEEERTLKADLDEVLSTLPNILDDTVPDGEDESANVEIRKWGNPPTFDFEARDHVDLGEGLGLMDFEAAARMSGARFVVLKGSLARLERALGAFMLDVQTQESGYCEVNAPLICRLPGSEL